MPVILSSGPYPWCREASVVVDQQAQFLQGELMEHALARGNLARCTASRRVRNICLAREAMETRDREEHHQEQTSKVMGLVMSEVI